MQLVVNVTAQVDVAKVELTTCTYSYIMCMDLTGLGGRKLNSAQSDDAYS